VTLHLQTVRVATGHDEDGMLVFDPGERLVAVLVRLGPLHPNAGEWFLETGFGRVEDVQHPTFASLDEAKGWIEVRLAARFCPA
jgi:hypothetical protein